MEVCQTADPPHSSLPTDPGSFACHDALGKWQRYKCAKKVIKNKCGKRRVRRFCPASCRQC